MAQGASVHSECVNKSQRWCLNPPWESSQPPQAACAHTSTAARVRECGWLLSHSSQVGTRNSHGPWEFLLRTYQITYRSSRGSRRDLQFALFSHFCSHGSAILGSKLNLIFSLLFNCIHRPGDRREHMCMLGICGRSEICDTKFRSRI